MPLDMAIFRALCAPPRACGAAAIARIEATRMFWGALNSRWYPCDMTMSDVPPPLGPADLPPAWCIDWTVMDLLAGTSSGITRVFKIKGLLLFHNLMAEIYRSNAYWADVHRRRARRAAEGGSTRQDVAQNLVSSLDHGTEIYTFIPNRAKPIISTMQSNGRIVSNYTRSDEAATSSSSPSSSPPVARGGTTSSGSRSDVARRAQRILAARPSADEVLLARLQETTEQRDKRKRKEFNAGIRKRLGPKPKHGKEHGKETVALGQKRGATDPAESDMEAGSSKKAR
ncbi:hypothetical protein C8R43DRAFT_1118050 [Mycena crocata]|nr:hypothetical protein C8R43DRAFT_1118050 [Mycena crocata]